MSHMTGGNLAYVAGAGRAAKQGGGVHFIFGLKYIYYKDQLGYLIIERRSNKLMVNTQPLIVFNHRHNK